MSENRKEMFRQLAIYSHVGMTFVLSIFLGLGIGWYLDYKVFDGRTAPWLTFIFLGVGVIAAFKTLWDLYRKMMEK